MKIPVTMPKWSIYTCFAAFVVMLLAFNVFLLVQLAIAPSSPTGKAPVGIVEEQTNTVSTAMPAAESVSDTSSLSPGLAYGICGGTALVSVLLLIGLFVMMQIALNAKYTTVSNELLAVSDWVFRNVLRRKPEIKVTDVDAVQQDIEDWYYERQKDVDNQVDARTEEWTKELRMATDFQLAMMERPYPTIPEIHITDRLRLNFFHKYQAASGLGGDFFDIIKVDRDVGGVFIADVMGHGTRSALITSILRTLMADAMQVGRNAPHFLEQVNKNFCDILKTIPDLVFASAFYFVGDTTSRMGTFSSAGHPPPIHIRRSVNRVEYLEVPPPRAAALGILPEEEFPGGSIRLVAEDVFIFYTDGLMEAFNPDGDEFGEERAKRVVERYMYQDIETIVNNLYNAVIQWADGRPMADDVCLIAVEVTTKPPEKDNKK